MACLAAGTGVVGCCPLTVRGGGSSLSPRSEALLFSKVSVLVQMGEAKKGLTVKAMAVAPKFIGTQRKEQQSRSEAQVGETRSSRVLLPGLLWVDFLDLGCCGFVSFTDLGLWICGRLVH